MQIFEKDRRFGFGKGWKAIAEFDMPTVEPLEVIPEWVKEEYAARLAATTPTRKASYGGMVDFRGLTLDQLETLVRLSRGDRNLVQLINGRYKGKVTAWKIR